MEQDFKATLQQQSSLEQWAAWLENVVTQVLKPYEQRPSFPRAARQFLLKWSFYRSAGVVGWGRGGGETVKKNKTHPRACAEVAP